VRRDLGVNQSRQTALDEVMPRSENAGEKICKKGLDNSGNIEGNSNGLFHSPCAPTPVPRDHHSDIDANRTPDERQLKAMR
jgi:hypothetical protein